MDRRQYLKHFLVLFSGTAAAQLINLAGYPMLARLYSPFDFGIFAMFVAISAVPAAVACFRFDLAVPTAPHASRFAIYWLCIAISIGMAGASVIGGAIYWYWSGATALSSLPVLLGLCVFLSGYCAASSLLLLRHDFYRASSLAVVARTGGAVVSQLALWTIWPDPFGLILGYCLGFVAQAAILAYQVRAYVPLKRPRKRQMGLMFRRYRRQVSFDVPSTLVGVISLNLMNFLLLFLYGAQTLGFYSLANRIAIVPLQLFNDSLSQVFFQKASRAQERIGHFWNEMKFNLLTSGILSVGVLVGVWLFARPFIGIYLGETWMPSANMLIVLAPMLALRSFCMSIATTVFVMRRAHWLFVHNVAVVALMVVAFALSVGLHFSLDQYLFVSVLFLSAEYFVFAAILIRISRGQARAVACGSVPGRVERRHL